MTSVARLTANRGNATKSTGPRTRTGKQVVARNATRHAILSTAPVVAGVENIEAWEAHRAATIASLAAEGHLEMVLADRVASLLWRLGRVTRYETEGMAVDIERGEAEIKRHAIAADVARRNGESWQSCAAVLARLEEAGDEDAVAPRDANDVIFTAAEYANETNLPESFSFVPPGTDWSEWTGWTKRFVLQAVQELVATTSHHRKPAGEVLAACSAFVERSAITAAVKRREANRQLADAEAELERSKRADVLPRAHVIEKVVRYETHLERSLYRTIHELQRLQAVRSGGAPTPLALDLDVSVGPRISGAAVIGASGER